jgi:hypothetical protein
VISKVYRRVPRLGEASIGNWACRSSLGRLKRPNNESLWCSHSLPKKEISIGDIAAVVGEHDLAITVLAEFLLVGKFTFRDPLTPLRVANGRGHDASAVEPMLDPIAANDDPGRVPFSRWFQQTLTRGFVEVIEGAGALSINGATLRLIANLIFQPKRLFAIFAYSIFEAAVASDSDLPLERQVEVTEFDSRNNVAAPTRRSIQPNFAAGRFPTLGDRAAIQRRPSRERLAAKCVRQLVLPE